MPVFRPTYQAVIPHGTPIRTKKGIKVAKFRLAKSDREVEGPVTPDGTKATIQTDIWYAWIRKDGRSQRVSTGVTKKADAEQIMTTLQRAADQGRAGTIDKFAGHRDTPLASHIDAYERSLTANGDCDQYVQEMIRLLRRVCKACNWKKQEDFDTDRLNRYLTEVKKTRSYRTRNKALKVVIAFTKWMQKDGRMDSSLRLFATIQLLNQESDPRRRQRRTLSVQELSQLLASVEKHGRTIQGVGPRERSLLYMTAYFTGLRRSELAKLERRHAVVDDDTPHIALPASIAKAKRADVIPLHDAIADRLRDWVAGKKQTGKLFHLLTENGKVRFTNKMMKKDMTDCGLEYSNEFGTCDFHGATRAAFITNLCRSGADFSLIVSLARHSDNGKLIRSTYDKVQMLDKAQAIGKLEQLALPAPAKS